MSITLALYWRFFSCSWVLITAFIGLFKSQCDINRNLFWRDGLHLNKRGNQALEKSYILAIKSITYSPPLTTFSLSTTTTPYKDQDECTYISQHIDNMSKIHKQKDKKEETHTDTHNKQERKIKKIKKNHTLLLQTLHIHCQKKQRTKTNRYRTQQGTHQTFQRRKSETTNPS
jgi:hypothetical protein